MADDDPVQPEPGQGGDATGTPYQEYLDRIPEEVRGEVEPVFKDWDANFTRRSQEFADYKRGWEPFEQLGVNQRDPAAVQWAMQFVDALEDPGAIKTWYEQYAQERGLTPAAAQDESEYIDPATQALVEQQLQAQLAPLARQLEEVSAWRSAQEQQAAEQQALSDIKTQMADLKAKHPDEFNADMVEKFVAPYIESDPEHAVQRAFTDWQTMRNQLEKDFLQSKADTPAAAEGGGTPAAAPDGIKSLKEAAEAAMEQLRANRTT